MLEDQKAMVKLRGIPYLITCILLMGWVSGLSGQHGTIVFESLENIGTIPDSYDIIQDRDGIMWISTFHGLYRFDGHSCRRVEVQGEQAQGFTMGFRSLMEDPAGRIWVSRLGSGLFVSDTAKMIFSEIREAPDVHITTLATDKLGTCWIGSEAGILTGHIAEDDTGRPYLETWADMPEKLKELKARVVFTEIGDEVWIGTSSGVYQYHLSGQRLTGPGQSPGWPGEVIQDINMDKDSVLWVSTGGEEERLFYYDRERNAFLAFTEIPFTSPNSLVRFDFDAGNKIWVSEFGNGLKAFDFQQNRIFLNTFSNSNIRYLRFIRSPYADEMGNMWFCSDGVFRYPFSKGFNKYLHPYDFDQSCSAILLRENEIWTAYREGGLVIESLHEPQTRSYRVRGGEITLYADLIFDIEEISENEFLLCGFNSVQLLDEARKTVRAYPHGGPIREIFKDSRDRVWIGGLSGLSQFKKATGVEHISTLSDTSLSVNTNINAIVEDEEGILWMASGGFGVIRYDPEDGSYQPMSLQGSGSDYWRGNDICLCNNSLWVATEFGLVKVDKDRFSSTLINENDEINNSFIASLVCYKDQQIWMSTNEGVSSYNLQDGNVNNYLREDGLLNEFFYPKVRNISRSGTIYFSGRSGIDFFNPSELRANPYPPRINFSRIKKKHKNGEEHFIQPSSGKINLSYSDIFLEIQFNGVHYQATEALKYAYRLRPEDPWEDIGHQRSILFSGLKAGDYQFEVKTISPDGLESSSPAVLPITVAPPVWQTLWFRISVILLIIGGILTWVKLREQSMLRKEEERLKLQRKMNDLEKKALLAQMNPHFIFNAMNSIQQFMFDGDSEGAMRYLARFSRLVRHVLNYSTLPSVPLSDEIQLIRDYIELELMRFPDKFEYSIKTEAELDVNSVEVPPFFIQPQVENAISHGLMPRKGKGQLQVSFARLNGHLRIVVEDNGVGRKASGILKEQRRLTGTGKGLMITQERLRYLHPNSGTDAFQVIDLKDNSGRPTGTRVEILVPIEE